MDPLIKLLDLRFNQPLLVLYLCEILRDDTKPPKKVARRDLIGFFVEQERRQRPGTSLDVIFQDVAEHPFVQIKRDGVRRCYEHLQKKMKSQQTLLALFRHSLKIA